MTALSIAAGQNHLIDLGLAVILGLAVGVGIVLIRHRLGDELDGPDDFEAQAGGPVLGVIPAFRSVPDTPAGQLVTVHAPQSPAAEAYRNLRALLLQAALRRDGKTLLVTSAEVEETTTTAANLAVTIAQSGRRVVLVCADLRGPRMHQVFGVENELGLRGVVEGQVKLSRALHPTGVRGLALLPAGPPASDPNTVLQAPVLRTRLAEIRQLVDLVVVQAPPMLAGADATVLMDLVDMVLLVGDPRVSSPAQVRKAVSRLELRDKLIGYALQNVDTGRQLTVPSYVEPTAARDTPAVAAPHYATRFVGRAPAKSLGEHDAGPVDSNGASSRRARPFDTGKYVLTADALTLAPARPVAQAPASTCRLYVIRHGTTTGNVENRYRGRRDIPLDAQGYQDAVDVARQLAHVGLAAVYTGPLQRTIAAAQLIADESGVPDLRILPGLNNIDYGAWEGMTAREAARYHPEAFALYRTSSTRAVCPGGERLRDAQLRMIEAMQLIGSRHAGEVVAAVTHAVMIRLVLAQLNAIEDESWRTPVRRGPVIEFLIEDGSIRIAGVSPGDAVD